MTPPTVASIRGAYRPLAGRGWPGITDDHK
jgi:hypothetical protein